MKEFIAPISSYPPTQKIFRPFWLLSSLSARLPSVVASYRYDITFLQREFISTLKTFESLTAAPRVFDVDDAIFLRRGGKYAQRIAQQSELVVCGNDYLAEYFERWNQNIVVVPTSVDVMRYRPNEDDKEKSNKFVIGWIGTSANINYLKTIAPALERAIIKYKHKNIVFRVICDKRPDFQGSIKENMEFVPWSLENEVENIQSMSIGIMPLLNSDWARGKCSYKMLQYMACGVPVVVSPIGMNTQVLGLGEVGIGATTQSEWLDAFDILLSDEKLQKKMGYLGREIIKNNYSTDVISLKLTQQFQKLI